MTIVDEMVNRIDLRETPLSDRGSRVMIFRMGNTFSIRLAERWLKSSRKLTAYRDRPALIDQWKFTDEAESILSLELTTYPHLIEAKTSMGIIKLGFLDEETILVKLPPGKLGMSFITKVDKASTDSRGGILRMTGKIRRNIIYTTNARILRNSIEPFRHDLQLIKLKIESSSDSCLILNITPRLGFQRYIPDAEEAFHKSEKRWNEWFSAAPEVADDFRSQYYFAWWVMRAGLISPRFYITREAMAPSKIRYVGVWQWDAYFHALAYRHMDSHLAHNQLRIFLDHQLENGMIPDAVHDEGVVAHLPIPVDADVTKPPLAAWTTWKLHQQHPDMEFLNEVYEPLCRYIHWWFENNDLDNNGLCEYQHPYSSGLDNSPLWDEGMPVESPDLNTYLYLEQEALAKIASSLGKNEDYELWVNGAEVMAQRLISQSWDPVTGLFWPRKDGQRINVCTPVSLYPILTGRLPKSIASRLVERLQDPLKFWPRFPVPSVALDDPKYSPTQMWRGPTWVNINYLLMEGLSRSGYSSLARELRLKTLEMICNPGNIYEYYQPETGERAPEAASMFGWSSAIFIDLAIQETRTREEEAETSSANKKIIEHNSQERRVT